MAKRSAVIAIPITVTTGDAVGVEDLINLSLSVVGVDSATYKVMVSYDEGESFVQHGSDVTGDADLTLPDATMQVRIDCSSHSSGTPTGAVCGVVSE